MPVYRYSARSKSGERSEGSLEAPGRREALLQLDRLGVVPVSLTEAAAADAAGKPRTAFSWRMILRRDGEPRMNARERLMFTRELSDLLASGMTLGDALHALAHRGEEPRPADRLVARLRDDIVQGRSLSEALSEQGRSFPPLYVSAIRAGEAAGSLTETLQRLSEHYERAAETRERIVTAMTYPSIVLSFGLLMMILLSTFVIPRFAKIFDDFGGTLPLPTRLLLATSQWLTGGRGLVLLGALVAAGVLLGRWLRTEPGRVWWHRRQLSLPILRPIVTANAFAQFARTLGSLMRNGVPVLQALSIVEDTVGNRVISGEIRAARERVTDGATISGPLAASGVFPRMLTDMLAVGERTGDLPGALEHIARRYEGERDRALRMFLTILEPLMILVIAMAVGFVAISMLLAVFDMTSGLAK